MLGFARTCVRIGVAAVAPAISHGFAPGVAPVYFLGFISYKSARTSASCRRVHFGPPEYGAVGSVGRAPPCAKREVWR